VSCSLNHINMMVSVNSKYRIWKATGVYYFPESNEKHLTCQLLRQLASLVGDSSWLIFGDFNIIMAYDEKIGGVQDFSLVDLEYIGDCCTWSNRQDGDHFISVRLDRFLSNTSWRSTFDHAKVYHLDFYASDHALLLLKLHTKLRISHRRPRLMQFKEYWLRDEGVENVVRAS